LVGKGGMSLSITKWIKADDGKPLWYVRPWIFGTIIGITIGSLLAVIIRNL
jgi:hypothetical protein